MTLKDEVISASFAQILKFVVAGAGSVWLAWKLGPRGLGTYAIVLSVAFIVSRPVNGLSMATKQRAASQDKNSQMTVLVLGVSLVFAILAAICGVVIGRTIEGFAVATIVLFSPMTAMATLVDVGKRTWISFSRVAVMVGLQIGLFELFGPSVDLALGAYVISNVAGTIGMFLLISPEFIQPTVSEVMSVWEYARYSIPANITGEITDRMDVLILGAILGSVASGLYEIAWRLTIPMTFLAFLTGSGHMRDVASEKTENLLRPLNYVSVIAIPFVVGSFYVGEEVLGMFFGSQYREAWLLLVGLGVFQVLRSQSVIRNSVVLGEDNPRLVVKVNTLTLVVNVTLGVSLAYVIGPLGVVIATVLTEAGQLVWYTLETGGPWIVSGVREQMTSAFVMGIVLLPSLMIESHDIKTVSSVILVGVITYGTVLFFRPRHRQLIRETI